ncbi:MULTISPECIES: hypothetical protein [unclassified Moorena]|uniref:hypothetical protein n=1 Tax=unclassified Moorena TaxID=2683338 RepID=UPI0013011B23|nr:MULTISPECIES: hypothetical protein [unclassified Moorena]NEQ12070.1 hypothetical protein [Moorena sp. SIO4E2]NER92248.1 hypothetical protein [Moorena sp. SIO3A2]NES44939.1 hypothetical protein [Moorena sp. SIO2C4]
MSSLPRLTSVRLKDVLPVRPSCCLTYGVAISISQGKVVTRISRGMDFHHHGYQVVMVH